MPEFEFEFNQQDRDLVVTQSEEVVFGDSDISLDYIRLTIYPTEGINNIVDLADSTSGIDGKAIFFSSLDEVQFDVNISPFKEDNKFTTRLVGGSNNDFQIYKNPNGSIYIKPNEIFNTFDLPQGNYRIQIDFLKQVLSGAPFIIKQISTSRKEIRLKVLNSKLDNTSTLISQIKDLFNNNIEGSNPEFLEDTDESSNTFGELVIPNPNYKYQFKHILNIGNGDHIPIMNYAFDRFTDGKENQSIILKLYNDLPTNISNLKFVSIEKEILTTQLQDIFYFSDVPDVYFGDGLLSDPQENWITSNNNSIGFQNLNQLAVSASIGDIEINSLISSSQYDYPNLNTDFKEFSNHTFFGSAKKKLQNFKTKVETIQGHYTEISSSLVVSSSIQGDSTFIIKKRKDLFNKINEEFKTFTPYERFLYFDGQTDSTSSAPSLKNYADTLPVTLHGGPGSPVEGIELNQHNGFNVVYKHSSEKLSGNHNQYIDLFTDKYFVENKPFFNYSGSIYLSFLLQGDSGSSLTWENRNKSLNPPLPQDTLYQNNILNPDMTSSAYQRYVFEASQSYFIPKTNGNDMADLSIDAGDFNAGSSKITILSGSVKTGSYQIKDSTNQYSTTVVSQSGVPFFGSVMPSGELFRIYNQNTLSSSLSGSYNVDSQTSGASVTNAMLTDFSGRGNTGSIDEGTPKISDGVTVHGRQYGKSMLFLSESNDSIRFFSDNDFNFNRDDNFSLSIWVKRFHPNTGSADSSHPSTANTQAIFTRGQTGNSYGIDYEFHTNNIRAAVRGNSSEQAAKIQVTDDLLNWNHVAFTYESGSATGIKLYLNGELKATHTTTGAGYSITGSSHFSASSATIGGSADALSLGGNDVLAGTNGHFNGFLQYPRVYGRTLTSAEVQQLYLKPDGITETKITDVKVTLKNPTDVLPFDNIFKTTSTEFTNWYNDMLTKAETFDTDNIHSFENNLPLYIQDSSEYNDMKDFLNLQGEQYDLIRNHIDSMGTIHKRGYKKTNSPPDNTLPMLLSNMGWQAINPFSGSLTDTLGSYLSGVTTIDDIKNNTWRKTLNNLLYIYKSKGTKNSVRGLLNTYGYPPDVLKFQEFGGESSPRLDGQDIINDEIPLSEPDKTDLNLQLSTGSFSFTEKKQKLYNYNFNANTDRILNLDWWMDDANINTLEFVYKHSETTKTQTILKSSGSGTQTLWDLRLIPSSDGVSSSFEFRLNNSQNGGTDIGSRGFSMSLAYNDMKDGQLWNVMIQRMTGSSKGPGTAEYRLHSAFQDKQSIAPYSYVTMSISGGMAGDSSTLGGKGFFANKNFQSSGSRGIDTASNLVIGETFSGSLSEIKGWATQLSISKFRQHTLNKFSTVGNTINSHKDDLVYHFKLNENYISASVSASGQNLTIVDASPTTTYTDYSIIKDGGFFTSSIIYGFDFIDVIKLTLKDNATKPNDNTILINPNQSIIGNLHFENSAVDSFTKPFGKKPQFNTSPKLELYRSPQTFIDDFILDNLSGFNLETLYGSPINYYSQSYDEFDTFRNDFFTAHPIEVNVNTFIRAHENMFNDSIAEGIKTLVPARSTFSGKNSNVGVEIKPTLLEKQKYENEEHSIEANPNTGIGSIDVDSITHIPNSNYETIKEGTIQGVPSNSGSLELPLSVTIKVSDTGSDGNPYLGNAYMSMTSSVVNPYSASFSYSETKGIQNIPPTLSGSSVPTSKNGTIDYASIANKSFEDVHKNWGTSSADVQHINFAGGTGSYGTYNTYDIEKRFVFHAIGDNEYYSASSGYPSHFTNINRIYNRLMIDTNAHASVSYQSLINGSGSDSNQTGKMMGKTRYFITSSDGNIILPSNHVTKFSQPFKDRMNEGTQNTNPGTLPVQHDDYSTASFYRISVTGGENQLIVKGGAGSIGGGDKIIYD